MSAKCICSMCGETCKWIAYAGWMCKSKCRERHPGVEAIRIVEELFE